MEYSTLHNDDLVRVGTVLGTGIFTVNEDAVTLRELKEQRERIVRAQQALVWVQDNAGDGAEC